MRKLSCNFSIFFEKIKKGLDFLCNICYINGMSRPIDLQIKQTILDNVLSALAENGLNNLSLRDVAREVGISARMLIYHFGSYENLINSVLIQLSKRHKAILKEIISENSEKTLEEVFRLFIMTLFTSDYRATMLLFLELYARALRDVNAYGSFFDAVLYEWIEEVEAVINELHPDRSRIYAPVIVAFYRGLMLDWLASNDSKRIIECSNAFAALIDNKLMSGSSDVDNE